ncbi:MAG: hypothetical protein P9L88_01590 [Candidatus Tantalella remota]|nr:hypothetical protein [Candidatus Tantalella remota]
MKKFFILLVILVMVFNVSVFASTNKPLKNLGEGLDEIVYGQIEVPDSINETNTKGTPAYPECTSATNDDVGRGIARFVGGVWRIATFWYPEDDAAMSK